MKRLLLIALALALLGLGTIPALGENVPMWNEVNGEEYGASVGAHAFEEKLEEISGGRLAVELYLNATLGSEAQSMQGIQIGTLDIFRGNASSLAGYGAELISATGLPFLFSGMEEFHEFAQSDLGRQVLDSVAEADCGYVALGWMVEGPRSIFITGDAWRKMGSPDQVSLENMRGLVMRSANEIIEQTLRALGTETVNVVYSELKKSLQAGNVDGAENGATNYLDNEFYQAAPYFIPDAHIFGCGVILMSQKTWDRLTDEERDWVRQAADAAEDACYAYNLKHEQACIARFTELGVTSLPVSDMEKWQEACQPLYSQQSAEVQELVRKIQNHEY